MTFLGVLNLIEMKFKFKHQISLPTLVYVVEAHFSEVTVAS